MNRLVASVSAWIRRRVESRERATFRRSGTNLDVLMGVRGTRRRDARRTRLRQATYSRAPGRTVDWPGPVPSEWRRRHGENYVD